jgi:hypothetical protein
MDFAENVIGHIFDAFVNIISNNFVHLLFIFRHELHQLFILDFAFVRQAKSNRNAKKTGGEGIVLRQFICKIKTKGDYSYVNTFFKAN